MPCFVSGWTKIKNLSESLRATASVGVCIIKKVFVSTVAIKEVFVELSTTDSSTNQCVVLSDGDKETHGSETANGRGALSPYFVSV